MLTVKALSAAYGDAKVLHDVSLGVPRQSCAAIVGESGSGKTTLARCIVGLHPSFSGDLYFDDRHLAAGSKRRSKDDLRRIRYVFQNPYTSLNPRKTVGELIAQPLAHFFRYSSKERESRVADALLDVSLQREMVKRYPDELSGGERQRVAIARALVVEPDVLVCDEVTSALDVSVQAIIVELLRKLQSEHRLSLIFITHNLALVRSIAQYVLVLANGTVVESGPTASVLDAPQQPYTVGLINDIPKLVRSGSGLEATDPIRSPN